MERDRSHGAHEVLERGVAAEFVPQVLVGQGPGLRVPVRGGVRVELLDGAGRR